jgi:hypothetical protein
MVHVPREYPVAIPVGGAMNRRLYRDGDPKIKIQTDNGSRITASLLIIPRPHDVDEEEEGMTAIFIPRPIDHFESKHRLITDNSSLITL